MKCSTWIEQSVQHIPVSGMVHCEVIKEWWSRHKELRFSGVVVWRDWTGWSAGRRLDSVISGEHLSVAVGRRDAEHCTAVDHTLTQLLKHSVSIFHWIDAEHRRNYLQRDIVYHRNNHDHSILSTQVKVLPCVTMVHEAGMSQGIPVFITMAHKGVMWLAPHPAIYNFLLSRYPSLLSGLVAHQNLKPKSRSESAIPAWYWNYYKPENVK